MCFFNKDVKIKSNLLNGVDVNNIFEQIFRIDQEQVLKNIQFTKEVRSKAAKIDRINDISLDDFMLNTVPDDTYFINSNSMLKNLIVNGYLFVEGLAGGVNFTNFCHFLYPSTETKKKGLAIRGRVYLENYSNVNFVNEHNLSDIAKTSWFTHQETYFPGHLNFQNVVIKNVLNVQGYVDGIKLTWLAKSYFSKTKNQTVTSKLNIRQNIIFESNVSVPKVVVSSYMVSDLNLKLFVSETLRNVHQIIPLAFNLDNIVVKNIFEVNALVNGLNLQSDVMRNNELKNIFNGTQNITNISTKYLIISKGVNIQNTNVHDWFQNATMLNKTSNIKGLKTFKNVHFKNNVYLKEVLNSRVITEENTLTRNTNQLITGIKTFNFYESPSGYLFMLKNAKINKHLNNIDIYELIQSQIDRNKNSVSILSKKTLTETLTVPNVNFQQTYQRTYVTDLIENITKLDKIYNYEDEYGDLLKSSNRLITQLKYHAQYLKHYKIIQTIKGDIVVTIPVCNFEYQCMILTFLRNNTIIFYSWSEEKSGFSEDAVYNILESHLSIIQAIHLKFGKECLIYIETINMEDYTNEGYLYEIDSAGGVTKKYENIFNNVESLVPFVLPDTAQNCILVVFTDKNYADIQCSDTLQTSTLTEFQKLQVQNGVKAAVVTIEGTVYILIVNRGLQKDDSRVDVWKYDLQKEEFILYQSIHVASPNGVDVIYYRGTYYLAISSSFINNSKYFGGITIKKFDRKLGEFVQRQDILQKAPVKVKFVKLPTNELVLYVLTNIPTEPLVVYMYEGIAGFSKKISSMIIPSITSFDQFTINNNNHFVVVYNQYEANIIQAMFKGSK